MKRRVRVIALLLLAASAASCASSPSPSASASGGRTSTQVRCLGDPAPGSPGDAGLRPLFFLFCMQSP